MSTPEQNFRFWSRYARSYLYEPQKKASGVTFVVFIFIIFLSVAGFRPILQSISNKSALIKQREQALTKVNERITYIKSIKPAYDRAQESFNKLNAKIPKEEGLPDFLSALSLDVAKYGYSLSSFSPLEKQVLTYGKSTIYGQSIFINLDGNLQNILPLIRELEASERYVVLKNITLGNSDSGRGKARIEVQIYYAN